MSWLAIDLAYATAQWRLARVARPLWHVEAWEARCLDIAARLLDTGEPLILH